MIPRYARPEMTAIWSPESKYGIWLEIETLAAEAMEELGQIPQGTSAAVREKASFEVERRRLAMLDHPGIARIVDGGSDAEHGPYMAIEFVEGEPIDRWAEQHGLVRDARIALLIEAATALSLPRSRTWRAVILPQAIRNTLPSLGNWAIAMFKDTPFLIFISVPEMVTAAREFGGRNFSYLEAMTVAGLLFLLASYPTAVLMQKLEKKLAY